MQGRRVTVFGGSGFIGRHLTQRLAHAGARVRVAVRDAEGAKFLKPLGAVGQIVPYGVNIGDRAEVAAAVADADAVVNATGILAESGRQSFRRLHVDGPAAIAAAAAAAGCAKLVHLSAIGADPEAKSRYARSKGLGEAAVRDAFPAATILRPSVVFGPEDDFFNRFAAMARCAPALPLIDGGHTKFQPVYVGDVADAIVAALDDPADRGRVFTLAGPRVFTFAELMALVCRQTGRRRLLLPVPLWAARIKAAFLQFLPTPPLTPDQVRLLETDNIAAPGTPGLAELGVSATDVEAVLPTYLGRFRPAAARLARS